MNNQKVKMTHNEFVEYMKANANRLYSEKGYTMAHYNQDCDNVEVLDYDLSRFQLDFSEDQLRVINAYFTEETVSRLGNMRLVGHTLGSGEYRVANTLGIDMLANGAYNGFGKSDENKCLFEFCEGDIYLILCENEEAYKAELDSFKEFYHEVYGYEFADETLNARLENAQMRAGGDVDKTEEREIEME